MSHFGPLPGDPRYGRSNGADSMAEAMGRDVEALQQGGVDAVMFSNEGSQPWMLENPRATLCAMAHVIGILKSRLRIPFGVHVIWDAGSTIELAAATGADFAWEVYTGVFASDYGLWDTEEGEYARMTRALSAKGVKRLCEILPEAAKPLGGRALEEVLGTMGRNMDFYACCIAGLQPGVPPPLELLRKASAAGRRCFASTGMNAENILDYLPCMDGAIIGSAFKKGGMLFEPVDGERVRQFMALVNGEYG